MKFLHIALQCPDEAKADIFFSKVLNLKKEREFFLEKEFSEEVFSLSKKIKVIVFSDKDIIFEIFIYNKEAVCSYNHVCVEIEDKQGLVKRCEKYAVSYKKPVRKGKEYLFIRDFAGNIFEIK